MINTYKIKACLSILVLAIFVGCTDDFVEREIQYSIDSENYFNSEEDYELALIGAYDGLQAVSSGLLISEIASNNALTGGGGSTDQPNLQDIGNMRHTDVNDWLTRVWQFMFAGVYRASYILEFQDKTDFEGKNEILAQAKFLRAYYNFELVKFFGPIPIKETRMVLGDETSIPRASVEEVYAFIENDLNYAVENLFYTNEVKGRVTKGTAQALLGKAYLYQDKFEESAAVLNDLITNGPYELVDNFGEIFEFDGENGIESVFEIQYVGSVGINPGDQPFNETEGNFFVGFNGVRSYVGPLYEAGYGFTLFREDLVNLYDDADSRKNVTVLDIVGWKNAIDNYTVGDLTDEVLVDDITLWKSENSTLDVSYDVGTGDITDYYNKKYIARKTDNAATTQYTEPNNYRAIRYSDVLLMAAEALNRGTIDDGTAQMYLNKVRERAFGDTSQNTTATGVELTEEIYKERRLELAGEGHHFFDLVRTGRANKDVIPNFDDKKHILFPVPFEEIQYSNGNWEQNAGY